MTCPNMTIESKECNNLIRVIDCLDSPFNFIRHKVQFSADGVKYMSLAVTRSEYLELHDDYYKKKFNINSAIPKPLFLRYTNFWIDATDNEYAKIALEYG